MLAGKLRVHQPGQIREIAIAIPRDSSLSGVKKAVDDSLTRSNIRMDLATSLYRQISDQLRAAPSVSTPVFQATAQVLGGGDHIKQAKQVLSVSVSTSTNWTMKTWTHSYTLMISTSTLNQEKPQ